MTDPAALIDRWTSYIQSLRLWVMEFVVWMAGITRWRELRLAAQSDLRALRADIRFLLVTRLGLELQAGRLKPVRRRFGINNPEIDRHVSRRRFMRFALRGIVLRTIDDARRILDDVEPALARVARNLREGVMEPGCYWGGVALARIAGVTSAADAPDT